MRDSSRPGMTFVEVLVAAGILVTGCLVIIALLPAALKAQQMSRFRIYAAASATTLMEAFAHPPQPPNPGVGYKGNYFVTKSTNAYTQPPSPGWASHMRSRRILGSSFAPDLEQVLSRPEAGLIPVPFEIARRLDSDGGEIGKLLDDGGTLFYLDPAQFRGASKGAASTDPSALAGIPEEFQQLVCAVVSPAQQNTLPAHPFELAGPPVQRYPFPPLWQWWDWGLPNAPAWAINKAYSVGTIIQNAGNLYRCITAGTSAASGGPNTVAADITDNTVHWQYMSAVIPVPTRTATVSEPWNPATPVTTSSYADPGDLASAQGWFAPSRGTANGGISWVQSASYAAPAPDSTTSPLDASLPVGQPHGCLWKYQADVEAGRSNAGSPWVTGWWAFKRLAGDEWAGWMPVQFALEASGTPPTYEQLLNYRDRALFLWMRVMPPSLRATFPAPVVYAPDAAAVTALTSALRLGDYKDGGTLVSYRSDTVDANRIITLFGGDRPTATPTPPVPPWGSPPASPTGYLTANVQAHGLEYYGTATELWSWSSDVDPSSPYKWSEFRWIEPKDYANDAAKTRLRDFTFTDPYSLTGSAFPPHPAQVLALSYLAHASMLVAGSVQTSQFNGYRVFSPVYGATGVPFDPRVTDADRVFARKVHEMSLRWAVACANERPTDYGAPRPQNRPVMNDRLIQYFDLWYDNVQRSTTGPAFTVSGAQQADVGMAVRKPKTNMASFSLTNADLFTGWDRGNTTKNSFESFYRWIEPPNPNLPGRTAASALQHVRSNVGPVGFGKYNPNASAGLTAWQTRCDPDLVTRNATVGSPWPNWLNEPVAGNDVSHGWVTRPYLAQHRARELAYWAVDWKSYEDAEEAPSNPVDFQRTGRHIDVGFPDNYTGNVGVGNWVNTAYTGPTKGDNDSFSGAVQGSGWGGPEFIFAWTDETRIQTFVRSWSGSGLGFKPSPETQAYVHLGAFGADRNMNGVFDRGPVPRSARMRAQSVARFTYYDPILSLDPGGK